MGDTTSTFENLPLSDSTELLEFFHENGKYLSNEKKILKKNCKWDKRCTTIEDESGELLFRLEKDPGSFSAKTTLRSASGEEIARCQINEPSRFKVQGFITVKENGEHRAVATVTSLPNKKDNSLFLFVHSPRASLESAKKMSYEKLQPALVLEGDFSGSYYDIVAEDYKKNPLKLAKVTPFKKPETTPEEMNKKVSKGKFLRRAYNSSNYYIHNGGNVDLAFIALLDQLIENMMEYTDAKYY